MIIFDCDDVLVDSESIATVIYAELLTAAGCPITAADLIRGDIGQVRAAIWQVIADERGTTWPEGLPKRADALLPERIETDLRPVRGIAAAPAGLPGKKAAASSPALPKLRLSPERCGLTGFFDPRIFSASQVARGKPFPDVFLFAAAQSGEDPKRCIVVEDSVAGITAALAAGMRVVGFTGGLHSYPEHAGQLAAAGAGRVFPDPRALAGFLAAL